MDGVQTERAELVYTPRFLESVGDAQSDAVEALRDIPESHLRRVLDFLHAELMVCHVKFAVPTDDPGSILGKPVALATTVGQVNELNRLVVVFDSLLKERLEAEGV